MLEKLGYSYPTDLHLLFLQEFCDSRRFVSLEVMVEDPLLDKVAEYHLETLDKIHLNRL